MKAVYRIFYKVIRVSASIMLAAVFTLLTACGGVSDLPDPSTDFYVSDFADVISAESTEYICTLASALDGVSGAQIVTVTLPSLGEYSIDRYGSALFSAWGVGDDEKNNGIMILLCPVEEQYWLVYGDGVEIALGRESIKGMMAELLEPQFAEKSYDAGVCALFDALYEALCSRYNVSPVPESYDGGTYNGTRAYEAAVSEDGSLAKTFTVLLLLVVIVLAFVLMVRILLHGVLGMDGNRKKQVHPAVDRPSAPVKGASSVRGSAARVSYPESGRSTRGNSSHTDRTPVTLRAPRSTGVTSGKRPQSDRRGSAAYEALKNRPSDGTRGGR